MIILFPKKPLLHFTFNILHFITTNSRIFFKEKMIFSFPKYHFLISYFYFLIIYFSSATKTQSHKEPRRLFFYSEDNFIAPLYLQERGRLPAGRQGGEVFFHEKMIFLFPKKPLLHFIFYILHFTFPRHEFTNFFS